MGVSIASELAQDLNKLMSKSIGGFAADTMTDIAARKTNFIPSDFLDLNRITSGSLFSFQPEGQLIVLAGREASGKSLVALNVLKNSQDKGYLPVLLETESALQEHSMRSAGFDFDMGEDGVVARCGYIEQVLLSVDRIVTFCASKGIVPCIVLDSLGNLDIEKTLKDVAKGSLKMDQGTFARSVKVMLKHITNMCSSIGAPLIIVTHVYFQPGEYFPTPKIYGGQHLKFLANTSIFLSSAKKKDKSGFILKALTMKNRVCPALQEAVIDIDLKTSKANRYAGLTEVGLGVGMFEKIGNYIYVPHLDKKLYQSQIDKDPAKVFTQDVLLEMEDKIKTTGFDTITFNDGDVGDIMNSVELSHSGKKPEKVEKKGKKKATPAIDLPPEVGALDLPPGEREIEES